MKGDSQSAARRSSNQASSPSDVDAKLAESEDDELEELEELLGSSVLLVSMGSISLACEACAQLGN